MSFPDIRPLELSLKHLTPDNNMMSDEDFAEKAAGLTAKQKAAANTVLDPSIDKKKRKIARADFHFITGQLDGLFMAFGKER